MTGDDHTRNSATPNRRTVLGALGAALGVPGARVARAAGSTQDQPGIPPDLPSAIDIDPVAGTVTLPLFRASGPGGDDVYYVLTESSSLSDALSLGLNWSPKLANALGTEAVQEATVEGDGRFDPRSPRMRFSGTVDFAPEREVVPGPEGFPLDAENSRPGSVGDEAYSPLVTTPDREVVFDAPHVENATGAHDAVVALDRDSMTVTLRLVAGFYEDRGVLYVSTDAYPADVAALEGATFAPTLAAAPAPGDRSLETAAREPIFPVVNGPMGEDNPQRQGLRSAVAGEGGPLNVVRSEQVCDDPADPTDCSVFYSPLWDVHPVAWTEQAIDAGERRLLTDHEEIIELAVAGDLVSAGGGPVNTLLGNVRAADAAVNCPLVSVGPEPKAEGS